MDIERWSDAITKMAPLKINPKLCSRIITPRSSCEACLKACPYDSITITKDEVLIGRCDYCGICASVCPNDVFRLTDDYFFTNPAPAKDAYIFSCAPYLHKFRKLAERKDINKIHCFGQIYPELLLNLLIRQKPIIFFCDQKHCDTCLKCDLSLIKTNLMPYAEAFAEVNTVPLLFVEKEEDLQAYLIKDKKDKKEQVQVDAGKRSFFGRMIADAGSLPTKAINEVEKKLSFAEPPPPPKAKSYDIPEGDSVKKYFLERAVQHKAEINPAAVLPYQRLQVSTCNLCQACAKMCPTKALTILQIDGEDRLIYQPVICANCNICLNICFFKGISWGKEVCVEDIQKHTRYIIAKKDENLEAALGQKNKYFTKPK